MLHKLKDALHWHIEEFIKNPTADQAKIITTCLDQQLFLDRLKAKQLDILYATDFAKIERRVLAYGGGVNYPTQTIIRDMVVQGTTTGRFHG